MSIGSPQREICLVFFALAIHLTALPPQKETRPSSSPQHAERKVTLQKNARNNGYSISTLEGSFYLDASRVKDPLTNKLIEGSQRLLYMCSQNGPEIPVPVSFTRGNAAKIKIGCALPASVKVLLLDEPAPGQ